MLLIISKKGLETVMWALIAIILAIVVFLIFFVFIRGGFYNLNTIFGPIFGSIGK